MKLLLFSDLHRDLEAARALVEWSREVDVAICAGDLAVQRKGLKPVVDALSEIRVPTVLVPGNGESVEELEAACVDWPEATVLHGSGVEIEGWSFWGVGGGVPVTPFGAWSWDFSEEQARTLLVESPAGGVLVSHSPPFGHVDRSNGEHLGSRAVLEAVERTLPVLVVCGHIHSCWRQESTVDGTRVINAGPEGIVAKI